MFQTARDRTEAWAEKIGIHRMQLYVATLLACLKKNLKNGFDEV